MSIIFHKIIVYYFSPKSDEKTILLYQLCPLGNIIRRIKASRNVRLTKIISAYNPYRQKKGKYFE